MANLNEVRLIGRLTRDPELRTLPSGTQVCNFGLATNRKYRKGDGVMEEETTFVEISCFGKLAETVAKYLSKGRQLYLGGRLKFESWNDAQTGQKRSTLKVIGQNIEFLDSGQQQQASQDASSPSYTYQGSGQFGGEIGGEMPAPSMDEPPF